MFRSKRFHLHPPLHHKKFYETTPTQGVTDGNIGQEGVAEYTTENFGKIASPYVVRYIYEDYGNYGEYIDMQYRIRRVGDNYMIRDEEMTIEEASNVYVKSRRFNASEV
jgi:hypothetical protein